MYKIVIFVALTTAYAKNNSSVDSQAAVKQIFAQNNSSIDSQAAVKQIFAQNNSSIDSQAAVKQIFAQNNTSIDSQAAVKQIFAQNNTSIDSEAAVKQIFAQNNSSIDSEAAVKQIFAQNNSSIDSEAAVKQIFAKNNSASGQNGSEQISNKNNSIGWEQILYTADNGRPKSPSVIMSVTPAVFTETKGACVTASDVEGQCVVYYLCVKETFDRDSANFHVDFTSPCEQHGFLYVCCPKARRIDLRSGTTAKPMREGCGWRNPGGVGFQIGDASDEITKFAEFPWVAAILKIENGTDRYIGSGSLIHPNVVLTAAHYVDSSQKMRVRIGEWDTQTTMEIYPYQERDVAKVEIHKDFNKGALFYDIALLFLASPVEPAPNVGVVCLPPTGQRALKGTRCLSTGWGKDKFGKEGLYSVLLQKVDIPVVERKECLQSLRKTRLGDLFELHSSFMCAGGERDTDTCKGDSGSPLVCPIENEKDRYVQNGIVAWGIGCGSDGTPGVYVDVANLREWIDDKVKGQGYQIDGYSYTV